MDPVTEYQTDHDLIVGMVRDLKHFGDDIHDLKEGVNKKNDDHEARIRELESARNIQDSSSRTWRYAFSLAISIVGIGLTILTIVVTTHS